MTAWLRPRPVENPRLRLVMFHHAGGSGSTFFNIVKQMGEDVDVVLHELPGRGRRYAQAPIDQMSEMVAQVARDLGELTGELPLALFGHSLGAIVASELARKLTRDGTPPLWLGVSGRQAPTVAPRASRLHLLPDDEFLHTMLELGGTPERVLQEPEFVRMFLRLARADFTAVDSYGARPDRTILGCPIHAYAAVDDPWAPPALMENWALETGGPFHLSRFDGGHFYFTDDSCARLGRQIARDLTALGDPGFRGTALNDQPVTQSVELVD
ncbi:thioesterase II family protein [Paracoccus aminophilus]|uniref:Thioesterase n=1 Tax=Paracoccus aminophilus JCM 7686 TaxID=1367847 RepID=S5Y0E5_PARAH|nr:alpha/beta fold hydrolase [Paracoccus aminophilus]AGT09195.1 thioesterase [Paracoccus aminophilus JCM 7686]